MPTTSFLSKLAKVGLAGEIQLQQDNQRTLNHDAAVRKALANQHLQVNQALMSNITGASQPATPSTNGTPPLESDDMGNILIDSPTTNYYGNQDATPPTAPAPTTPTTPTHSLLSKVAPYLAGGAVAAAATGLGAYLTRPNTPTPPPAAVTPAPVYTNTASGFTLDLGDPKK